MIRLDIWRSEVESAVVDAKRRAMGYHKGAIEMARYLRRHPAAQAASVEGGSHVQR